MEFVAVSSAPCFSQQLLRTDLLTILCYWQHSKMLFLYWPHSISGYIWTLICLKIFQNTIQNFLFSKKKSGIYIYECVYYETIYQNRINLNANGEKRFGLGDMMPVKLTLWKWRLSGACGSIPGSPRALISLG